MSISKIHANVGGGVHHRLIQGTPVMLSGVSCNAKPGKNLPEGGHKITLTAPVRMPKCLNLTKNYYNFTKTYLVLF